MSEEELIFQREEGVEILYLNRKAKRNALSSELSMKILEEMKAKEGSDINGFIISSSLDIFSSGIDLEEILEKSTSSKIDEIIEIHKELFKGISFLRKPVILLINGDAYGLAVELTHVADYVLIKRGSKLAITGLRFGIIPPLTPLILKNHTSKRKLIEILTSGRKFECDEAYMLGFVDEIVEEGKKEAIQKVKNLSNSSFINFKLSISKIKLDLIEEGFKITKESLKRKGTLEKIAKFLKKD